MLDRHVRGNVNRVSPESPCLVHDFSAQTDSLGGAANVAALIADSGLSTSYLSTVGLDPDGQLLHQLLDGKGVSSHLIRHGSTTTKTRVISKGQHLIRLDNDYTFRPELDVRKSLTSQVRKIICDFAGLNNGADSDLRRPIGVFSDYNKGFFDSLFGDELWNLVTSAFSVIVDPKRRDLSRYRGAFLVKPNQKEFAHIFGHDPGSISQQKVLDTLRRANIDNLLVTLGADGAILYEGSGSSQHFSAVTSSSPFHDPTGAGDVVTAVLSASLASGETLHEAIGQAMAAAGRSVGKVGNADWHTVTQGFRDLPGTTRLAQSRAETVIQPRVAFANGCFDLLHAGHYNFLRAARSHGDRLVVGLNSDQSVQKLKGAHRPLLPFAIRKKLLLESGLVDHVMEFDDADASRLLQQLTVHVYVRSSEYARKATAEDRVIDEKGVIPAYVERTPRVSTTSLIESAGHD